jgi:hypothetical protein
MTNSSNPNIKELYVDHLIVNLEKRSIFDIIVFLSKYCGWDNIRDQFENHVRTLEGAKNGEEKTDS